MLKQKLKYCFCLSLIALTACATVPAGPGVAVMPAPGKPFDLFTQEDAACRQWAEKQLGLSPQETIDQNTASGAVVGTAIGAGVGALLGAASGRAGTGALIGGAGGMLVGAASGANSGQVYGREAQRRYDTAYLQCMYSYGNQVAGRRVVRRGYPYRTYVVSPPPTQPYYAPVPPPPVPSQPYYEPIPPPPAGATPQTPPELR